MELFNFNSKNIGIDLGTASILAVIEKQGIYINEPSIIAIEKKSNKVVAVGNDAKEMIGKTPEKIEALRPLQHAGIANLKATEMIIKNIIKRIDENESIGNPKIIINLHIGMTEVEKRAVLKAVKDIGIKEVYVIEELIAAALGAGIDIFSSEGEMVVDLGAGTTETAIISLGKIVSCDSLKIAGDDLDESIIEYIKKNFNLEIGKNTAEKIKIKIGYAKPIVGKNMEIKGRDLYTGLPKQITIDALQVNEAIRPQLNLIIDMIRNTIDRTPPELVNSIYQNGIILTGGGAYIKLFDELISQKLGIKIYTAERPLECTALGIGKIIQDTQKMKALRAKKGM